MQDQEQQLWEFVSKADDMGPFCKLTELKNLLETAHDEIRETPLYHYLHGVLDARCFWDKSFLNDLEEG
ncbi:hypothetical protein [Desulfovibrio sp. Huiquan2017]|uniref:hypothetical protein n=1 Tax=Desulfovibrio sp. Huiquan2017 TaxID=2816861 RepID=UPI001A918975|nr:hypothetical protein [Desulfovibrio sp. Huiquan2017]